MSFTVKKENGELIFNDLGGYQTRNSSTMWCITKADEYYKWNDFTKIKIHTGDYEDSEHDYTYSKKNGYKNLVPDFNFHSWPQVGINDYISFVNEISAAGRTAHQVNKVGWIGNTNTNYRRKHLLEIGNKNNDLFEFFDCGNWWENPDSVVSCNQMYIYTPDLVKKYSILIDIEGVGYSGRLKHLLWSHRPLLIVDRPHKEYFFEHLNEWKHYIPVKRDLSDLLEKSLWCLQNYDKALHIAENAYQFSKLYLTREACYTQWNYIIKNIVA
jgi:hypothetical protein